MSHYDEKVATEVGLTFHVCKVTNEDDYINYRHVLLLRYPELEGVGYPTYVMVDELEHPTMLGSIRGGIEKGKFREKLQKLLP